jgi:hypothetical protein
MGSLRSFENCKYFRAPQMECDMCPSCHTIEHEGLHHGDDLAVILYHPETSGAEVTFDALSSCIESPLPELEQSSAALTVPSCTRCEGVLQMLL